MRARDCGWRQPSGPDGGQLIQLIRRLASCWANSVVQEQARHERGRIRNISRDASPVRDALHPNPASIEMQNLWPIVPGLNGREWNQLNRAHRLAGNTREGSSDHEQLL